jgi:Tfp pilus assembly protein PilO
MASKKFSDLSPVQQAAIVMVLPAVAAVVLFYDFVRPLQQNVTSLRAQLQTLQVQNRRGRVLEAHRAELLKHIAQAQEELQRLREIVPDRVADDQVIKTVYKNASLSDVRIRSLVAGKSDEKEYFTAMAFQLHADGTYYGLLDFFIRLAHSSRIVDVSGLFLQQAQAGGGRGTYKVSSQDTVAADCVLTTYFKNSQPPTSSLVAPGRE